MARQTAKARGAFLSPRPGSRRPSLSRLAQELEVELLELSAGASFLLPYFATDAPGTRAEVRVATEHAVAQLRGAGWCITFTAGPDGLCLTPDGAPHG